MDTSRANCKPQMLHVYAGHVDLVKHLLRRGKVDIAATNKAGRTVLDLAPNDSTRQAITAAIENAAAACSQEPMETEAAADAGDSSNPSDSKQKKRRAGARKRPYVGVGEGPDEEAAEPPASIGPSIGPAMPPGFHVDRETAEEVDDEDEGRDPEQVAVMGPSVIGAQEGSDVNVSHRAHLRANDGVQPQIGTEGTGSVPAVPPTSGPRADGTKHPRKISRVALSHLDDDDDDDDEDR